MLAREHIYWSFYIFELSVFEGKKKPVRYQSPHPYRHIGETPKITNTKREEECEHVEPTRRPGRMTFTAHPKLLSSRRDRSRGKFYQCRRPLCGRLETEFPKLERK